MQPHLYRFGPFRLDTGRGLLLRQGREIPLRPKSFETLRLFVERPGKLWTKDELMAALWPDVHVEENNLSQQISALRRALAHSGNGGASITAVRGRGYRFVAEVIEEAPPLAAPPLALPAAGRSRRVAVALVGLAAGIAVVLTALALRSVHVAPRLARHQEVSPAAYEAYLKGRYLWNRRTLPDLAKASEYFEQAIRAEPGFASAYAGLADAYNLQGLEERGEVAARRALELDPDLAEAHAALAIVRLFHDFDWGAAERELKEAISLQPSYASAHHWYAFLHAARGRFGQALAEIHQAHDLDPLSLIIQTDVGQILLYARRYGEAEQQLQEVLRLDPTYAQAHRVLAQLYLAEARFPEAERMARGLGTQHDEALARLGERREAEASVRLAEQAIRPGDPTGGRNAVARVWISLGDADRALHCLEQMPEARDGNVLFLDVDPAFDPLRRDPRFVRLVERVGLGHH